MEFILVDAHLQTTQSALAVFANITRHARCMMHDGCLAFCLRHPGTYSDRDAGYKCRQDILGMIRVYVGSRCSEILGTEQVTMSLPLDCERLTSQVNVGNSCTRLDSTVTPSTM